MEKRTGVYERYWRSSSLVI